MFKLVKSQVILYLSCSCLILVKCSFCFSYTELGLEKYAFHQENNIPAFTVKFEQNVKYTEYTVYCAGNTEYLYFIIFSPLNFEFFFKVFITLKGYNWLV